MFFWVGVGLGVWGGVGGAGEGGGDGLWMSRVEEQGTNW